MVNKTAKYVNNVMGGTLVECQRVCVSPASILSQIALTGNKTAGYDP